MSSTPAANHDLIIALATAAGEWLSAFERVLPEEKAEILRRGVSDPASEISVRVEFKSKAVILEVSDGTQTTELVRIDIGNLPPSGHVEDGGEGTDQY
jgi:hypothetical protein